MNRDRVIRILADAEGCTTSKAAQWVDAALSPEAAKAKARATMYRQGLELMANAHPQTSAADLRQQAIDAIALGDEL